MTSTVTPDQHAPAWTSWTCGCGDELGASCRHCVVCGTDRPPVETDSPRLAAIRHLRGLIRDGRAEEA